MWSSAWKSKIDARFIIKLFVSFRGVAAKGLVRNGRPRTHKQKTELRNRLWQDTKLSSFARVFFCQLIFQFLQTFLSPKLLCERAAHEGRSSPGEAHGEWLHAPCGHMSPVAVLLHMSVFSNLLTGRVSLDYLQKEVIKKETVKWMWCF